MDLINSRKLVFEAKEHFLLEAEKELNRIEVEGIGKKYLEYYFVVMASDNSMESDFVSVINKVGGYRVIIRDYKGA
jgi:hypothetical protein